MKKIALLLVFLSMVATMNNDVYGMKRKREGEPHGAPPAKRQKTVVGWAVETVKNFASWVMGTQTQDQEPEPQPTREIVIDDSDDESEVQPKQSDTITIDDSSDEEQDNEQLYQKALKIARDPRNNEITKIDSVIIRSEDIKRLVYEGAGSRLKWLNDNIIDAYMKLLEKQNEQQENVPNCAFKTATFYLSWLRHKRTKRLMVFGKMKTIKENPKKDIFNYDKIIFPINPDAQDASESGRSTGSHWVLGVINLRDKKFECFNSMYNESTGRKVCNVLKEFLKKKWLQKEGFENFTDPEKVAQCNFANDFEFDLHPNTPQQENFYDCGVFTCKFAERVSQGKPINFSQRDIPRYRKKICIDILRGYWKPEIIVID